MLSVSVNDAIAGRRSCEFQWRNLELTEEQLKLGNTDVNRIHTTANFALRRAHDFALVNARNTTGGSITVPLTSCLIGLKLSV